jgi:quercetin dioxygenase-like cupin family protein
MIFGKSVGKGPVLAVAVMSWTFVASTWANSPAETAAPEVVQELMRKELTNVPGKNLQMLTVEYPPGGASPPHRHHAQVFVYVLSGSLRMQVKGSPVVTLRAGQTFYEGIEDEHTVSENASRSEPAKILVFMVKDGGGAGVGKTTSGTAP